METWSSSAPLRRCLPSPRTRAPKLTLPAASDENKAFANQQTGRAEIAQEKENAMERHFELDLNEVKERLLWMGSLAERAVHQAIQSVLDGDALLAESVLKEEPAINELQME